jgi:archaellum component FlaC
VTADTLADGTFTGTVVAPATEFKTHTLTAVDEYGVNATDPFKIGLIAMLINPTSGPSGTEVGITGIGFASGTGADGYNMTFGDEMLIELGDVTSEQISANFFVPSVAAGSYSVTVIDTDENELTQTFTVTATTSLTVTPDEIAIGYNMSIYGEHFTEVDATALTFYVYNSTWGMDTPIVVNETAGVASTVTEDGNFTGYWIASADLLLGNTYTMNCTDANDLYAEFDFVIVEEEVEIGPNKASYSLGDTITFTIKATFAKEDSYLEITDPNEDLIFLSTFTGDWTTVGDWQVVLTYNQVNDGTMNPFMIPSDGDTGTWVWTLYDSDDDVIENGTIEVLPTSAAQVDARLTSVEDSLTGLSEDLGDLTGDLDDVQTDISSVMSDISDLQSDLDNVATDIIGDLSDDIAAATSAANAAGDAVDDLESTVSDIADTANSAKTAADAAAAAATSAASAADEASSAANGLTGLVYGAIGASLIAALAAIFAVMQISRRIAG